MPVVYNATNETQTVKAAGNWFTFKPGSMKNMDEFIARFISSERADYGLVVLPEEFEDPSFVNTPDGKTKMEEFKVMGVKNYVSHLRRMIYNNQVSMRLDLEKANLKIDPAALASPAEIEAAKLLKTYEDHESALQAQKLEETKKIMQSVRPEAM